MPETPSAATAAEGQATADQAAAGAQQAAAPQVDYNALLDQIPDDVLAQHRRLNGRIGGLAQRQAAMIAQQERARIQQEERERAQRERDAELLRLAQENPFEFAQKFQTEKQAEKARQEIEQLRANTERSLFESVAQRYAQIPEWRELQPDDFARIQQRVAGKDGAELVAEFNTAALDVLAERRAAKGADARLRERLAQERAAWEAEANARRLRGEPAPDMSAPVSANGLSVTQAIRQMSDREFNDWYDRNFKG